MSYSTTPTRDQVKRTRAKAARRVGQATVVARSQSLREALRGAAGVGIVAESGRSIFPFDTQKEYDEYSALYDTVAMGRIARALREPEVRSRMTHDNGTAPELHICGKFLNLGWQIGHGLLFQDKSLFGFRRHHRVFVSDVALVFGGRQILVPVDGEYFHNRLEIERNDDGSRNLSLKRLGQVMPIPARYCFEGATLDDFLSQHVGATI